MKKFLLISFIIFICIFQLLSLTINVPVDHTTIQEAINSASNGDLVLVQPGTYSESIDFLGKSITVASLYHTTLNENYISTTIINANISGSDPGYRAVTFQNGEDSNSILKGLKIINGDLSWTSSGYDGYGGGIFCNNSSPTIDHIIISDCDADDGAAIAGVNSDALLQNININSCNANDDAAVYFDENSDVNIVNLTVSSCFGNDGGAVSIRNSSA